MPASVLNVLPMLLRTDPALRRLRRTQAVFSSKALPPNFTPLPPIPPRPTYPIEWLSDADCREYLYPLYSRQWSVAKHRPPGETQIRFSQLLSKLFVFRSEADAMAFVVDVTNIANKLVVRSHICACHMHVHSVWLSRSTIRQSSRLTRSGSSSGQ